MYSCCVLIVTKFTDLRHARILLYLNPFCLTVVQNMEERNWNVLLPGDFLCRVFLALPFSSFCLFVLCFSVYFLLCSCSTWPLRSVYTVHANFSYLAGPVLLLAICIGRVLLGRHQGHTWSTPGYSVPFASSVCPGFPFVLSLPAVLYRMGIRTISVLHTLAVP
jgi:hypothetical protein